MGKYTYDYNGFSFTLEIPDYWEKIYRGKPREELYHDYKIMLNQLQKMSKDKYVLDVGVNHGIFSVPAALLGYKVIGFEPVNENFSGAAANMLANGCEGFHLYNYALSNVNEQVAIYVPECPDNASLSKEAAIANMKGKEFRIELVDAIRFDDWIKYREHFANIGFIKIDTQGSEYRIIEGAKEFLTQAHDVFMVVEYEKHLELMGYTFDQLNELILSIGFEYAGDISSSDKLFYKP